MGFVRPKSPSVGASLDIAAQPRAPRRGCLRYSLRGLCVIVLLSSLPAFWVHRQFHSFAVQNEAIKEIAGGTIRTEPAWPIWLWRLCGKPSRCVDVVHAELHAPVEFTDAQLAALCDRRRLKSFNANNSACCGDSSIQVLADQPRLETLRLNGCRSVTDRGVAQLTGNRSLKKLDLARTSVADASLDVIRRFSQLESITIVGTKVTDLGVTKLAGLPNLHEIYMGPGITAAAIAPFRGRGGRVTHLWLLGADDDTIVEIVEALPALQHADFSSRVTTDGHAVFSHQPITDVGVACLKRLSELQSVRIESPLVTARGLMNAVEAPKLTRFVLRGSAVGKDDLVAIKKHRPKVSINAKSFK